MVWEDFFTIAHTVKALPKIQWMQKAIIVASVHHYV